MKSVPMVARCMLSCVILGTQVKGALRELGDVISDLLTGRRAGVVASLVAAAGRAGNAALQVDVVKSLSSGIAALQSAHSTAAGQVCFMHAPLLEEICRVVATKHGLCKCDNRLQNC